MEFLLLNFQKKPAGRTRTSRAPTCFHVLLWRSARTGSMLAVWLDFLSLHRYSSSRPRAWRSFHFSKSRRISAMCSPIKNPARKIKTCSRSFWSWKVPCPAKASAFLCHSAGSSLRTHMSNMLPIFNLPFFFLFFWSSDKFPCGDYSDLNGERD